MKKRLDLVINGKGGVGKSFFAVNFVQFLKDRQIAHVAYDSDNENSTLKRFHPEAEFLDLADPRGLDHMFRAFERTDLVVVDCRAASSELLLAYFDEIDLEGTLNAAGAALTVIMPVNHELDSIDQLQLIARKLGSACTYVIVRNAVHSDSFAIYDQSAIRKRLHTEHSARELAMTRLHSVVGGGAKLGEPPDHGSRPLGGLSPA